MSADLLLSHEQVPDILFEGIHVATKGDSLVAAFKKGWSIYIKDIGCSCTMACHAHKRARMCHMHS